MKFAELLILTLIAGLGALALGKITSEVITSSLKHSTSIVKASGEDR